MCARGRGGDVHAREDQEGGRRGRRRAEQRRDDDDEGADETTHQRRIKLGAITCEVLEYEHRAAGELT